MTEQKEHQYLTTVDGLILKRADTRKRCFKTNVCNRDGEFLENVEVDVWSVEDVATDDEIALFKRAEHFHGKGRKLNEFKVGDLMTRDDEFYLVTDIREDGMIYDRAGLCGYSDYEDIIIYLTAEELEAAAKEVKR